MSLLLCASLIVMKRRDFFFTNFDNKSLPCTVPLLAADNLEMTCSSHFSTVCMNEFFVPSLAGSTQIHVLKPA